MKWLILIFLGSLSYVASAQTNTNRLSQTVRGKVIDRYSESILPEAKVFLFGISDSMRQLTDDEGNFRFENVPVGRYTLVATMLGYENAVLSNLELTSSKELVLEIKLTEEVLDLDEVKIVAREKGETINQLATVSARSFSVEESQRYAGSFNDVARMAQNFAGVQGADDSRNDIIIRGNSPSGVLYRMEGLDIPNPNHFARFGTTGGPVSMLNNNVLANSDFFTGAFPAEYGNALAGVFDLKMRKGNNEKFEFMGQIGLNGLEGMAEGPISRKKRSSFLVNYRYSTFEVFQLIGLEFGTAALPKYQDISFKLNFPHKKGLTQIFGIGGLSKIEILSEYTENANDLWGIQGNDIFFGTNTGMIGINHKQRINDNSFFEVMLGAQVAESLVRNDTLDSNGNNPFTTFRANSSIAKQSTVFNYQNKFSSRHLIKTGLIFDVYALNLSDSLYSPITDQFRKLRDFDGTMALIRPHFQHRFRLNEDFTLVSGVYGQFLSLAWQWAVEPRIGLEYQMKHQQQLTFGYGLHSQMAPIETYFDQVQLPDGSYETPNRTIGFTRSNHLIAGYQKRFKHGIKTKIEAYGQYLTNVPVEATSSAYSTLNFGATFITSTPDTLENTGFGYNYGVEVTLEKPLDNGFYFLVTASLFNSKYQGSDQVWRNTAFNGNHTFNALAGYEFRFGNKKVDPKFKSALSIDLKFTWNGGGRYSEIMVEQSQLLGTEVRDLANAYEKQYGDYLKGNARIAFKLIGKNTTQEWAFDIQNFTDRDNIFYEEYNAFAGKVRTVYQNGFLPVFQYRITF